MKRRLHADRNSWPDSAAGWFALNREDEVTEESTAAFVAWLAADPEHQSEYDRLEQTWAAAGTLADDPATALWIDEGKSALRRSRPQRRWYAVAASLTILVVAVGALLLVLDDAKSYVTNIGEQRLVVLDDGSYIRLNTDTRIEIAFTADARRVRLPQGEALFDVEPEDKSRPFLVETGDMLVHVTGTRFNVKRLDDETVVEVLEGTVDLIDKADLGSVLSRIGAGEKVTVDPVGQASNIEVANIDRIEAWQEGRLEFSAASLEAVIEEFNRYSKTRIVIGDPELNDIQVSGAFQIGRTASLVGALEEAFPVRAVKRPDEFLLLPDKT